MADVLDTDYCCARCGSSMSYEVCAHCVDGLAGHDCGEDCCSCADPEDNVECDICEGEGGWFRCLSSEAWCEAHPRRDVPRHTVEWFEVAGEA